MGASEEREEIRKFARRLIVVVSGVFLFLVAWLLMSADKLEGFGVSFADLGGDFSLKSSRGDVSLSDYKGKVVVLYFGYLSCPQVCPVSMGVLSQSLNDLSEEGFDDVQVLLVSIDPINDTVEKLDMFTNSFHDRILGLTGAELQIQEVAKKYGAFFEIVEKVESQVLIDHVTRYYIIGRDGNLVDALRHGSTSNEITARIKMLL
jgi:protein SCO1